MFKKDMFKKLILWAMIMAVVGGFVLPSGVAAQDLRTKIIDQNLQATRGEAKLPDINDPVAVVSMLVKGLLTIIAIVFFVLIIIAGFRWMTSGGNEEAVSKAKKSIGSAVIGLLVVIFAYAITYFVFDALLK